LLPLSHFLEDIVISKKIHYKNWRSITITLTKDKDNSWGGYRASYRGRYFGWHKPSMENPPSTVKVRWYLDPNGPFFLDKHKWDRNDVGGIKIVGNPDPDKWYSSACFAPLAWVGQRLNKVYLTG